jgi:hypothetical protein
MLQYLTQECDGEIIYQVEEVRNAYTILVEKPKEISLSTPRRRRIILVCFLKGIGSRYSGLL